jgi:hypothetical protein
MVVIKTMVGEIEVDDNTDVSRLPSIACWIYPAPCTPA